MDLLSIQLTHHFEYSEQLFLPFIIQKAVKHISICVQNSAVFESY